MAVLKLKISMPETSPVFDGMGPITDPSAEPRKLQFAACKPFVICYTRRLILHSEEKRMQDHD